MCHGHPKMHPCSHMSVKWMFCPKAPFDPSTGFQIGPCRSPNYYPEQSVAKPCSLQNCAFKALGGAWLCCQCGQGPNELGWCTATTADSSSSPPFAGSDVDGDWSYADSVSGCWNPDSCPGSCGHGCCSSCLPFGEFSSLLVDSPLPALWAVPCCCASLTRNPGHRSRRRPHRRPELGSDGDQ